jgi:allene oxide cyclase
MRLLTTHHETTFRPAAFRARRGLAVAIVVAAMFGIAASASAASEMHLIEHSTTDAVTDLGAKGDSAGDLLTLSNEIFADDNKTKLGSANGYCIRTVVGKAWECFWTVSLAKGQITTEGPYLDGGDSVLAITGGTGAYSTAQGEMALHKRDAKGSEHDFVYTLK